MKDKGKNYKIFLMLKDEIMQDIKRMMKIKCLKCYLNLPYQTIEKTAKLLAIFFLSNVLMSDISKIWSNAAYAIVQNTEKSK